MAKVLLADDEEALRLMMGRQLRRAGHDVTVAEDGQAAADLLEQDTFDIVVSDMKMPRLDGMGLLARASVVAPGTEFIILTGHGSMENAVEAFKTGNVFDYLLKPLNDIHELDAVVARAAERRMLKTENKRLLTELESRIQELEAAKRLLSAQAESDGLTGLLNHRAIHSRLQGLLDADAEARIAVVALDMDDFKRLNDTYGHPIGDKALQYIAAALRTTLGPEALIGRCGGDEFMAVLPSCNNEEARNAADRTRQYMDLEPFRNPEGVALPLRLCFGIADTRGAGSSAMNLVAAADAALYAGKRQGGDAITVHQTEKAHEAGDADRSSFDALDGLVTAIDHKDRYTREHSEHMTGFALQLAEALGCSEDTYNIVRVAGLLHDVGKIGVPDAILRKPGKLTPEEYEIMKSHVTISALIIHGIPRLSDVLDAVAHHHERWDGKGYPNGLAGDHIPFLGRIMAIADAFSAMTLHRPYRSAMPVDKALVEIERGAGSQFDPTLATLFVETVRLKEGISEAALAQAA